MAESNSSTDHETSWQRRPTVRWRLAELTDELNARPFPEFVTPTRVFRLCAKGPSAFDSIQKSLSELLTGVDWQIGLQGKIIQGQYGSVDVHIERHTEFTSVTLIEHSDAEGSVSTALPDAWMRTLEGDIVVAVDATVSQPQNPSNRESVCASVFEDGQATAYFDFTIADDGHTKIHLDFAPGCDPKHIGRITRQVIEIETYRCFAALGLPKARDAQKRLWEIANLIPDDPEDQVDDDAVAKRYEVLSGLSHELEQIWRDTSFRFNACEAYWSLVLARLEALDEQKLDLRPTLGAFLERRLGPAIATYQSTARQRHNIADQVQKLSNLLQTRIELGLQRQSARLLKSLNEGSTRQLRLQQTVEGVSVIAISYYAVNLLETPIKWIVANSVLKNYIHDPAILDILLVILIVPLAWFAMHRLLRTDKER